MLIAHVFGVYQKEDAMFDLGTVICVLIGLVLIAVGYLLGVKGVTNLLSLLAGYDPSRVIDEKALARVAGLFLIVLGVYLCVAPFLANRFGAGRAFLPFGPLVVLGVVFVNIYCKCKNIL